MIIQAELRRKQSEYEGEACSVDKVIELPAQRFKQFSRALLADYDFIAESKIRLPSSCPMPLCKASKPTRSSVRETFFIRLVSSCAVLLASKVVEKL